MCHPPAQSLYSRSPYQTALLLPPVNDPPLLNGSSPKLSRAPSTCRQHSPALSTTSGHSSTAKPGVAIFACSHCLSISLEQELREETRGECGFSKKHALNREVSMSRGLSPSRRCSGQRARRSWWLGRGRRSQVGRRARRMQVYCGGGKQRAVSCTQSQMQSQVHPQPARSQRKATGRSVSTSLRAEACSVQGGRSCATRRLWKTWRGSGNCIVCRTFCC